MLSRRMLAGCFPVEMPLRCVARAYSASPAVGYHALHLKQQQELVDAALQAPLPTTAEKTDLIATQSTAIGRS
jgi:hypothetical protein